MKKLNQILRIIKNKYFIFIFENLLIKLNLIKLINYFIIFIIFLISINIYADTWWCEAKCNVLVKEGYPEHLGKVICFGKGKGNTRSEARKNAIKDAKRLVPEGTLPKHCREFDCFSQKV